MVASSGPRLLTNPWPAVGDKPSLVRFRQTYAIIFQHHSMDVIENWILSSLRRKTNVFRRDPVRRRFPLDLADLGHKFCESVPKSKEPRTENEKA